MVITASDGQITGTYQTAPGKGPPGQFPVVGQYDTKPGSAGQALSWTVMWLGWESITAWAGQYFPDSGEIVALWYLVQEETQESYNSTYAGQDTFRKDFVLTAGTTSQPINYSHPRLLKKPSL